MSSPGGWWPDEEEPLAAPAEEAKVPAPEAPQPSVEIVPAQPPAVEPAAAPSTVSIEPIADERAQQEPPDWSEDNIRSSPPPAWQHQPPPAWPAEHAVAAPAVQLEMMPINADRPKSTAAGKVVMQPAAVQYDTRTTRGKGRGRGTGRGRQISADKDTKILGMNKKRLHRPYFTVLITFVDIVVFAFELAVNKGIEPPKQNPMIGPNAATLIQMGAKYGPLIKSGDWWRLITPIFLHVGIVHILLNVLTQLAIGWSLEKNYGFYRIAPIYFIAGIVGNLFSTVFVPCGISVGASGALFGYIGVLFIDIIQNWKSLRNPACNLATLLITTLISFGLGLMPYLDNWVHIGGFIAGLLASVIILPNLYFVTKCCKRAKLISIIICVPLLLALIVGGFILIYKAVPSNRWCNWCRYISCLPVGVWKNQCTRSSVDNGTDCF